MLSLLALLLIAAPADTNRHPTVIIVRHAEKASETERDPSLSDAGRVRAAALDSVLADAKVVAILVTQYKRTAETAALVARLKQGVIDLMHAHGAAHLQIGKTYPYLDGRNPASVALLRAIKAELDPHDILNPGALGL